MTKKRSKLTADEVKVRFEERILNLLKRLAEDLPNAGFNEVTDVEYAWELWWEPEHLPARSMRLSISEAEVYGDEGGFNFSAIVTEYGGRILGQLTPYNYTPEVWTDDIDELEARWEEYFEPLSANELLALRCEDDEELDAPSSIVDD